MNFVSVAFLALFAVVLIGRLTLGRNKTEPAYLLLLLCASLVFYGWHVPMYVLILLFSTAIDFVVGRYIERCRTTNPRRARSLLVVSLISNLGLLAYFKYAAFLVEQFKTLPGLSWLMDALYTIPGVSFDFAYWVVLPIGISFYTFQSMSYSIDVYRGRLPAHRNFWQFLLYVAFFPQLVAGPIVRASDFLYQIGRTRRVRLRVMAEGFALIIRGYFLKVVVADNIGPVVDQFWPLAGSGDGPRALAIVLPLLFSCQIFADFAGYSSIARGLAYVLGFRLPVNFNAPYIAASFSDFWRRWHISLSRWLRDYLYVPLGGNRKGQIRTYVNLFLVMLLGGLWHGAALNFVAWGGLHGLGLAVERFFGLNRGRRSPVRRVLWACVVQSVVLVCWVFFREGDFGRAVTVLSNAVGGAPGAVPAEVLIALVFTIPIAALHLRALAYETIGLPLPGIRERGFWTGVMLFLILTAYGDAGGDFIYFQF